MGATENEQVDQVESKQQTVQTAITNRPIMANPAKQQSLTQKQSQQPRLIKKAYVRFDDYLDLNEENMRRSCKRLMNRLYNKQPDTVATGSNLNNGNQLLGSNSPPPISQSKVSKVVNDYPKTVDADGACQRSSQRLSSNGQPGALRVKSHLNVSSKAAVTAPPNIRKSYLRLQYERRQERQLNLINKMQQIQHCPAQHIAQPSIHELPAVRNDGQSEMLDNCAAKSCKGRHEQDLVAKSHELSKRRFFEKLERRESMKNSNLSTQNEQQQHWQIRSKSEQITSTHKNGPQAIEAEASEFAANKSHPGGNSHPDSNEDQLMLKLYQTLASGPRNVTSTGEDTLGGSTGPPSELQVPTKDPSLDLCHTESSTKKHTDADELIGFHTRLQMVDGVNTVGTGKEGGVPSDDDDASGEPLIEFFEQGEKVAREDQQRQQRRDHASRGAVRFVDGEKFSSDATTDKSAFEIKVSASELILSLQNPTNGFISSSQLVVKNLGSSSKCESSISRCRSGASTSRVSVPFGGEQLALKLGNDLDDECCNSQLMAASSGRIFELETMVVLNGGSASSSTDEGNKILTKEAKAKNHETEEASEELPLVDGSQAGSSTTCMQCNETEIAIDGCGVHNHSEAEPGKGGMFATCNRQPVKGRTSCSSGAVIWSSISSVQVNQEEGSFYECDQEDEELVSVAGDSRTTSESRLNSTIAAAANSHNKEDTAAKTIENVEQRPVDCDRSGPVASVNDVASSSDIANRDEGPEMEMAKSIGKLCDVSSAIRRNQTLDVGKLESFKHQRQASKTTRMNCKQDTPTYPVRKESTAQWKQREKPLVVSPKLANSDKSECEQPPSEPRDGERHDEAASLKTIITDKPAIRDVPPEATCGVLLESIIGPEESVTTVREMLQRPDDVASIAGRHAVVQRQVNYNVHPNEAGSSEEYEEIDREFTIDFMQAKAVSPRRPEIVSHVNERPLVKDPHNNETSQQEHVVGHEEHLVLDMKDNDVAIESPSYANPTLPYRTLVDQMAVNNVNHDYDKVESNPTLPSLDQVHMCGNSLNNSGHLSWKQPEVVAIAAESGVGRSGENKPPAAQDLQGISGYLNQPLELTGTILSGPKQRCQLHADDMTTSGSILSPRNSSSAIDEDRGSSCSSSGFGASVSATCSSSSSASSSSDSNSLKDNSPEINQGGRCPSGLRMTVPKYHISRSTATAIDDNVHYDTVRGPKSNVMRDDSMAARIQSNNHNIGSSNSGMAHYKQLVCPEEAYPTKMPKHPLVIENHGYATLLNRCSISPRTSSSSLMMLPMRKEMNQDKSLYHLDSNLSTSSGQYANLPQRHSHHQSHDFRPKSSALMRSVEYATVRTAHEEDKSHSRLAFNRRSSCSEASLSGLSYSTGHSGGFSKLPPVRTLDCPSANNFDYFLGSHGGGVALASDFKGSGNNNAGPTSSSAQGSQQPIRKASLLKRFGSLVSKAFTPVGNGAALHPLPTSQQLNERTSATISNGIANERLEQKPLETSGPQTEPIDSAAQQESTFGAAQNDHDAGAADDDDRSKNANANDNDGKRLELAYVKQQRNHRVAAVVIAPGVASKDGGSIGPKSSIDEVDLVILPTKHQKQKQQRKPQVILDNRKPSVNSTQRRNCDYDNRLSRSRRKIACDHKMRMNDTSSLLSLPTSSVSSTSSSSRESLAYSSLIASPDSRGCLQKNYNDSSSSLVTKRNRYTKSSRGLRRTSSLSEELESLMSYSCIEEGASSMGFHQRDTIPASKRIITSQNRPVSADTDPDNSTSVVEPIRGENKLQTSKSGRIAIDCISPTKQQPEEIDQKSTASKSMHSRSLLRWFSAATTTASSSSRLPAGGCESGKSSKSLRSKQVNYQNESCYEFSKDRNSDELQQHQPISGFWGLSSQLIEDSHDKHSVDNFREKQRKCIGSSKKLVQEQQDGLNKLTRLKSRTTTGEASQSIKQPESLNIYSSVKRLHERKSRRNEDVESDVEPANKCQSLNLYQNLMRNYVKRRHNNRTSSSRHHHHRHGHDQGQSHSGHHHHHHHHSASRHHYKRHTHHHSTRCGCGSNLELSSLDSKCLDRDCCTAGNNSCGKSSVWGQLIKISKSDGSQVIELQRAVGRSWGFFVARGAINNSKGIFISRMHDDVASSSLAGLLGIGDRILAIDECSIEPDYDILRVNQMISKKSKILLRVKPYKG